MAPLDDMSAPGTATYASDTMVVGDGTWDFTKNDFLLPNLVGFNLETLQFNGMGNRFSTLTQYHSIIKAHGIIGAIVFLFLVPAAIFYARFYTRRPGTAIRYHSYLQILAVLLTTVVFILGWFAVGPNRSLTNPHHGIGVAIYTIILLQVLSGWLIKSIRGRSLRVMLHQWLGRIVALLGMAQVPLGLALYGSPRYLFILYAVWMGILLVLYFIFSYRVYDRPEYIVREGRSEVTRSERYEQKSSGGAARWLGPLAAVGGLGALLKGRTRERSRSRDRSRSHSRTSRLRSRSRAPEVVPSRRESFIEEEKYSERYSEKPRKSGAGFGGRLAGIGAGLGAGALLGRLMGRNDRRADDEEYSAVASETPRRRRNSRTSRQHESTVVSDYTDESEEYRRDGRKSPLLPGPGRPSAMAAALSAAEARSGAARPTRPVSSYHQTESRIESNLDSDYSSYVSPSRVNQQRDEPKRNAAEKGLMAGLGLAWLTKRMKDRRDRKEDERLRTEEDERRAGLHEARYTGDGYSPSTPPQRRYSHRTSIRTSQPARTATQASPVSTEESSLIEPRPMSGYDAPLRSPLTAEYDPYRGGAGKATEPISQSRQSLGEHASIPVMLDEPRGILSRDSESESQFSHSERIRSDSRLKASEIAAAAALASAEVVAAEQEAHRRVEGDRPGSRGKTPPVSVKVKVHDDRDRNVTLRRLTEEEALAARRARRRRTDSASSLSGSEVGSASRSRYRRDTSRRRAAEESAESRVEAASPLQPSLMSGTARRPKDSAYFSGAPLGGPPGGQAAAGQTVSSLTSMHSPGSHGTWSGMSPIGTPGPGAAGPSEASAAASAAAAERRRRRRLERRSDRPAATGMGGTVDFV
ncbi:hypothetical protein BD289DRAFT_366227 [Coniella lustricola]|uniref:Cytochrome b561 domain-containing protein n=1 Tax=Coniella lustricola TaxID=2025994 RepID=A0A2T3ABB7_9PEZI|nr:hypothetical protein BD289DRAFT_366227 [Coniella lustricola]